MRNIEAFKPVIRALARLYGVNFDEPITKYDAMVINGILNSLWDLDRYYLSGIKKGL